MSGFEITYADYHEYLGRENALLSGFADNCDEIEANEIGSFWCQGSKPRLDGTVKTAMGYILNLAYGTGTNGVFEGSTDNNRLWENLVFGRNCFTNDYFINDADADGGND